LPVFLLFALAAPTPAQQTPKTEDQLSADLDRALAERDKGHVQTAVLELNAFYQQQHNWIKQAEALKTMVDLWSATKPPNPIAVARYSADLGEALERGGNQDAAIRYIRAAIAIYDQSGPFYASADTMAKRSLVANLQLAGKTQEAAALVSSLPPPTAPPKVDSYPRILSKKEPDYTSEALQNRVNGSVALSLIINEAGKVTDVEVLQPLAYGLDESAVKTVKKWKFAPAMKDGRAVSIHAKIDVTFRVL
jgi:TonB family protein